MKSSQIVFIMMVLIFIFFELAYAFDAFEVGYGSLMVSLLKSAVLFLFILLYSKKIKWAKLAVTILVLINGLVCLVVGMEKNNILFYAISLYSIIFVFCIHQLKLLKSRYH